MFYRTMNDLHTRTGMQIIHYAIEHTAFSA